MMPNNMPLDFLPHPAHSRSNSVSSSSTHSSNSRPHSSQGGLSRMHSGGVPSAEDIYRAYHLNTNTMHHEQVRISHNSVIGNLTSSSNSSSHRQFTMLQIRRLKVPFAQVTSVLPEQQHLLIPAIQTVSTLHLARRMICPCFLAIQRQTIKQCLGGTTLWPPAQKPCTQRAHLVD